MKLQKSHFNISKNANIKPYTAIMTSDDVLCKVGSCMSVGHRMTSGFNSHLSCTPKLSKAFEMNPSSQQTFSERLFLGAIFTHGKNALAGKGLRPLPKQDMFYLSPLK